jgi:Holliday junction resolvase
MNLVADEGVERQIVEKLRKDGHAVIYVAELAPSISDDFVVQQISSKRY